MSTAAYYAGLAAFGLAAGTLAVVAVGAVGAGVFWLYLFGDDPWPRTAETALVALAYAAGVVTSVAVPLTVARRRRGRTT